MTNAPELETGSVTGIGGFFFKSSDPLRLAHWYEAMLGIPLSPTSYDDTPWRTQSGTTVFAPFPAETDAFGEASVGWMINFRVDHLDAIIKRLEEAGHPVELEGNGEPFPNGRFAKLHDPDGHAIQLWEPGGVDPG